MANSRVTVQIRVTEEDKELFLFKSRNSGFESISAWLKWLAKNAPVTTDNRVNVDIDARAAAELFGVVVDLDQ